VRDDRPSGTVTFLSTDIENSSRSWEEQPTAMSRALARHDELLREAVAAWHGMVFSKGGDGLAAVFARAADAVEAAVAAQRALEVEPWPVTIRVRMAVHTGEAEERCAAHRPPPPAGDHRHRRASHAR
jgi:class 3 adenylate cyclase